MYKLIAMILLLTSGVNAFNTVKPETKFRYVGNTKPLGYFDPMQITTNSPNELVKYVREAELQHGRAAMLGFVSLAASELATKELGINALSSQTMMNQFPFWFTVAIFELARMQTGWQNPFNDGKAFKLEDEYQPGNVLNLKDEEYTDELLNKELNNGRLAMLGSLGIIAQELVTGTPVF